VPYTLLLADDSVTIQRVIELTFADEDVTVVAVSDGDQAITRLEAAPPDIVLADIGMPGKNGYEVAQFMRRTPKLAHIPVLLLTGAFEPVDQERANQAGCDGVLAKPFEPQLVIGRVKELLARGPRAAGAPAAGASLGGADAAPAAQPASSVDSIWGPPPAASRPVTPFADPPKAAAQAGGVPRAELNDYFDRLDAAFSNLSPNAPAPTTAASAAPPASAAEPAAPAAGDIDWFNLTAKPVPDLSLASPQPEVAMPASLDDALSFAPPDDRLAPIEESVPVPENTFAAHPEPVADDPFAFAAPIAPAVAPDLALQPVDAPAHAAPAEVPPVEVPPVEAPPVEAPQVAPRAPAAPALELPLPHPPALPPLADAFAALLAAEQVDGEPAGELWPATPAGAPGAIGDEVIEEVVRRVLDRLSGAVIRDAVGEATSQVAERLVREEIARIKASIR
jgi:CheY-like chemotaxis protein